MDSSTPWELVTNAGSLALPPDLMDQQQLWGWGLDFWVLKALWVILIHPQAGGDFKEMIYPKGSPSFSEG